MYVSSPDDSYEVLGRSSDFNSFEQTDGGTSSVEQTVVANKSTRVLIPRWTGADTFVRGTIPIWDDRLQGRNLQWTWPCDSNATGSAYQLRMDGSLTAMIVNTK
jgi:hypothetical protein